MDDQENIKEIHQKEFNANIVKRLEELEDKVNLLERYTIKGIEEEIRDTIFKTSTSNERYDDILTVQRNEIDNLKKNINAMKQVMNNYLMINLDNPDYITQIHEKRGNHGTSNTKGEKPRWMWILWRRHRRRHKIL